MFNRRDAQESLLNSDSQFLKTVGRDTFYGFLSEHRHGIFRDDDFAFLYCRNNGRPSVPPSILALSLLLQIYNKVSDDEAARRAHFDLQWQVALGIPVGSQTFVKSTLQMFPSQLILHETARDIFMKSIGNHLTVRKAVTRYNAENALRLTDQAVPSFHQGHLPNLRERPSRYLIEVET